MKKISTKKIVLIVAIVCVLLFAAYAVLWYSCYSSKIKPLISNAPDFEVQAIDGFTNRQYPFDNDSLSGVIDLTTPPFGKYAGNLSILQATIVTEDNKLKNPYSVDLTITLKWNFRYLITIYKSTYCQKHRII